MLLSRGKGQISQELDMVLLCKKMNWDYFTYLSQPTWFVAILKAVFNLDASYQNRQAKKMNK